MEHRVALADMPDAFARWRERCASVLHPIRAPAEAEQIQEETSSEHSARLRAEQWKENLLRTSPMVRFMVKHLVLVGCNPVSPREGELPPKIFIGMCPPDVAGGFSPSPPDRPPSEAGLMVCANRLLGKTHMEDTLAHEMIHWWDHCRFNVDWSNLNHHACSEIRAASLSGDCRWSRELRRHNYGIVKQHQKCVRRRAILSVESNPACPDHEAAKRAVDEVWDACFNDTRPFDEIY